MTFHRTLFLAFLLLFATVPATNLIAQTAYPTQPVKLVVPFPPGGATDSLGRLLASALGDELGQAVIVENRPGAGTVVAASAVANAPADGYTILLGASSTLMHNLVLRPNLSYDPFTSFTPIGLVADMGLVLLTHPDTPGNSLAEIVDHAHAAPGKLSYGSFGVGSSSHFAGESLKSVTDTDIMHVAFNGSSPSLAALMGGHVELAVDTGVASIGLIQSNKVRPIAVLSAQRFSSLPDVPTVAESGYPGFEMATWFTLLAPADLPDDVQNKLERALETVITSPDMHQKLENIGLIPNYGPGSAVMERVDAELPELRDLAVRANITTD